jgi:hypothetical protein
MKLCTPRILACLFCLRLDARQRHPGFAAGRRWGQRFPGPPKRVLSFTKGVTYISFRLLNCCLGVSYHLSGFVKTAIVLDRPVRPIDGRR